MAAATLLSSNCPKEMASSLIKDFTRHYMQLICDLNETFADIVRFNADKTQGRFLEPDCDSLINFDSEFPDDEKFPEQFEISVVVRSSGRSQLRWNDVFIGNPLSDNISDHDGYQFHDVFHLSHAAILHWSPTFRALIKHKRKSDRNFDENQDGGRAIAVEEGLTAWVFSCAKDLDYFENHNRLSFDLLKTVHQFVRGYEVEACPLRLWEIAILEGYKVFRKVRENKGGVVIGNLVDRTLNYKSL